MMFEKKITIGIVAHVDAGKTTLTEQILYKSGSIKEPGSVDKGSATTDGLDIEKQRGISVKSATVEFQWHNINFFIVDTPGHIDFAAEVDRSLSVLDLVVLVVSAKEGVQAHTINLWEHLRKRGIPTIIFVNKIDREGVDPDRVFADLADDLDAKLFALNCAAIRVDQDPEIIEFSDIKETSSSALLEQSFENLAEIDEEFLETFLEGEYALDEVYQKAIPLIQQRKLIPLLFGSAKLALGIEPLMHYLATLFPAKENIAEDYSARVFKISFDPKRGRLAYIRSYGRAIKAKDLIWAPSIQKEIKINQLFKPGMNNPEQINVLQPGEVGLITTSEIIQSGEVLGHDQSAEAYDPISEPVLSVQVVPKEEKDYQKLSEALTILDIEDPQLNLQWFKDLREFHLKILGPIQTEILKASLLSRFGIETEFMPPQVIYKETPMRTAEGIVRYTMPKPCWAVMQFQIEPGTPGSGVVFVSNVRTEDISAKYQNEVKRAIPWSLRQGVKGWEVTDIRITLSAGEEHVMHSNPGDFLLATPMGVMRAIEAADTHLLEPMYHFEIKAHQDVLGALSSDLNQRNSQIHPPVFHGETFTLSGRVPVEKALDYGIRFNAITSGKGRLKLTNDGYEKTQTSEEKYRDFRGVCPLNEAQWILHNRGAFKADERRRG